MKGWDRAECAHLTELEKRLAARWLKVDPATVLGPPTGLIVGEMPSSSTSPRLPMFPYPPNSAGGRLLKMSRLTPGQYLGRLRRVNFYTEFLDTWDRKDARRRAEELIAQQSEDFRVVLCGQRVADAFGFDRPFKLESRGKAWFATIPHPSGRNHVYNDPVHRTGAASAIQWAANIVVVPTDQQIAKGKA